MKWGHLVLLQESEGEEAGEARVTLAQDLGHGNLASRQSRVQLQEVWPDSFASSYWALDSEIWLMSGGG